MKHNRPPRRGTIILAAVASLSLIGTGTALPQTATAAPATPVDAAATADAYDPIASPHDLVVNNHDGSLGPKTGTKSDNKLQFWVQLEAYASADGTGTPQLTHNIGTVNMRNPNSIVNRTTTKTLYQRLHVVNTSDSTFHLKESLRLPKSFKNEPRIWPISPAPAGFDATGLKSSFIDGALGQQAITYSSSNTAGTDWPTYSATDTATNLEQIGVEGDLAAGASFTLRIPMVVDPDFVDKGTTSFSIGLAAGSMSAGSFRSYCRISSPELGADGEPLIPLKGRYIPSRIAVSQGKWIQMLVPELDQYMPVATQGVNYWVSAFSPGDDYGTTDQMTWDVAYPASRVNIDSRPIHEAVKTHGWAALQRNDGPLYPYVLPFTIYGDRLVNPDWTPAEIPADRTAPTINLRPIVLGADTALEIGSTFNARTDTSLALKVYTAENEQKKVDLNSPDISIDDSQVNTSKVGSYPVTVTYTPAGVSNTFQVKVTPHLVTPAEPTQSGDTVTIPTTPGVDYQIDGTTVTGDYVIADGQAITVTAVPHDDYAIADGAVASWEFSYKTGVTPTPDPSPSDDPSVANPTPGAPGSGGADSDGASPDAAAGPEVPTSGLGGSAELTGLGFALTAAGLAAAGAVRSHRRKRN